MNTDSQGANNSTEPSKPLREAENEDDLTSHTVSMREALRYCRHLAPAVIDRPLGGSSISHRLEANAKGPNLREERLSALRIFWGSMDAGIPAIQIVSHASALDFQRQFHDANIPCLVRGLESHFASAATQWVDAETGKIRREWFIQQLGSETHVPVRYQPVREQKLDADGRADECAINNMPIREWIDLLEQCSCDTTLYLKDWHLVSWLKDNADTEPSLYTVPAVFPYDLLNAFLTRHTAGDYRFVYWGPADTRTPLHSDVLNSYSWSYNVCGCKEWTFYAPPLDNETPDRAGIKVTQKAGECIFVPAGWKHHVINCEESLSINHNWITTANLDLTWECLQTEMKAIRKELLAWNVTSWEAFENMLLGCVGLNVSSFFWMMLSRVLELLREKIAAVDDCVVTATDLRRLSEMLSQLLRDEMLHLQDRLAATLCDHKYAIEAVAMAEKALELIDHASHHSG